MNEFFKARIAYQEFASIEDESPGTREGRERLESLGRDELVLLSLIYVEGLGKEDAAQIMGLPLEKFRLLLQQLTIKLRAV